MRFECPLRGGRAADQQLLTDPALPAGRYGRAVGGAASYLTAQLSSR
jgi:hypothetical protein